MSQPHLVIHGHFYQPPRENPWTGRIEKEASAAPFHDWNERIHAECYRPNAFARVFGQTGHVTAIVNNYELMSFNVGPTLARWMTAHHPRTFARILEADRASRLRNDGHGNAIAQPFNHPILPLLDEHDARTQIRWGLAFFAHHFGRPAEGMWLPETACNPTVLGYLIDEGVRFTILDPSQAGRIRRFGAEHWTPVTASTLDPSIPYRFLHPDGSGRSISLFFYDAAIARAIAFEGALASSQGLIDRFQRESKGGSRLVHAATDGESYGHHSRFGDRCLAYALSKEAPRRGFSVTNYGRVLESCPPEFDVELSPGPGGEGTSWSCPHGLARWKEHCGCQTGGDPSWRQDWRAPLRTALSWLKAEADRAFLENGHDFFTDPWEARDLYIDRLLDPSRPIGAFMKRTRARRLTQKDHVRAMCLLETQRFSMGMFTSCGWFFNDLGGIETIQVLKYAGRLIDEMKSIGLSIQEKPFLERLAEARSNLPARGNGAEIYARSVLPSRVSPPQVAASIALTRLGGHMPEQGEEAGFRYSISSYSDRKEGRFRIGTGRTRLQAAHTGRLYDFATAAIFIGGADFYGFVRPFPGDDLFAKTIERLDAHFVAASMPSIFRMLDREFGPDAYGLEHLATDTRTDLFNRVFSDLLDTLALQYTRIYDDNRRVIEMLRRGGFEMPALLRLAAEFALARRFENAVLPQDGSLDPSDYAEALSLLKEAERNGVTVARDKVTSHFEKMIVHAVKAVADHGSESSVEKALGTVSIASALGVPVNLDEAQELLYPLLGTSAELVGVRQLALVLGFDLD